MGVGKTSVSRVLASRLNLPVHDTDALIETQHGDISNLITAKGESIFRDIEYNVFSSVIQQAPAVVSTGGGMVTHAPSRRLLDGVPKVIWLQASFDVIDARIKNDANNLRPLADHGLKDRYLFRQNLYEECATFTVNVDALSVEEVAEKIINRYA